MDDLKFKIAVFDGTNFSNWKFRLTVLLEERDLKQFIEKDLDTILEGAKEDTAQITALKLKEKKCKSLIIQCIADSHLEYVKEKEHAKDIYDLLVSTFERKSLSGQIYLRKRLLTLKCNEGESIENHFLVFDKIVRDLKSTGATLEEEDVVCHLLLTLPKSFEAVVTALETLEPKKLTIEFVKSRLLDEGNKRKNGRDDECGGSNGGGTDSVAMQSFKKSNKIKCYKCGKMGHRKSQCKQEFSAGNKPVKQANVGQSHKNNDLAFMVRSGHSSICANKEVTAKVGCSAENNNIIIWCVDSGATDHMVWQ